MADNLDIRVKTPHLDIKPAGGKIDPVFSAESRPPSRLEATFTVLNGPYVFAPKGKDTIKELVKVVGDPGRDVTIPLDLVRKGTGGELRFEIDLEVKQLDGRDSETGIISITVTKDSKAPAPAPLQKAAVAKPLAPVAAPAAAAPVAAAAAVGEAATAPFADLKKRRHKAGLTQKTLHELSEVSVSTISRLERLGKDTNCTEETRRKIEDALRRIEDALR